MIIHAPILTEPASDLLKEVAGLLLVTANHRCTCFLTPFAKTPAMVWAAFYDHRTYRTWVVATFGDN